MLFGMQLQEDSPCKELTSTMAGMPSASNKRIYITKPGTIKISADLFTSHYSSHAADSGQLSLRYCRNINKDVVQSNAKE